MNDPEQPETRYLFLYKIVGGLRQRLRFTLDTSMTIISEETCGEDGMLLTEKPHEEDTLPLSTGDAAQVQLLKSRGYEFRIKNGKVYIDSSPESEQMVAKFFIPDTPCMFPGCEELRKSYLEERQAMAGEGASCRVSSLQRKYRSVIMDMLRQNIRTPTVS
jgi:hypothetical protein